VSGPVQYLFNCLSHPGTCTKEDIPEIRRAAAACNGDMACIASLRQYAAEAGLPVPRVSMGQALMDFLGWGVGGGATLAAGPIVLGSLPAAGGSASFFEGAYYSEKVLVQATRADFHGFPAAVDGFAAQFGSLSTRVGADGASYTWLTVRGSYMNRPGVFEYIKDAAGKINHRLFVPD
jgi:hypothetical protein